MANSRYMNDECKHGRTAGIPCLRCKAPEPTGDEKAGTERCPVCKTPAINHVGLWCKPIPAPIIESYLDTSLDPESDAPPYPEPILETPEPSEPKAPEDIEVMSEEQFQDMQARKSSDEFNSRSQKIFDESRGRLKINGAGNLVFAKNAATLVEERDFLRDAVRWEIAERNSASARAKEAEKERDAALDENLENSRLLGMSAERECKLITERDAALEEVERYRKYLRNAEEAAGHSPISARPFSVTVAEIVAKRDQLQRDLDEMTKDRDLWQDEHQDECPYFMELANVRRDLDEAKGLLKESKSLASIGYRIGEADMRGHDKIGERWGNKQDELIGKIDKFTKRIEGGRE